MSREEPEVVHEIHDRPPVVEREIHHVEQKSRRGGFLAGLVVAVLLIVGALTAYFVLSDDDDDGQLEVDVPSVEVDVDS